MNTTLVFCLDFICIAETLYNTIQRERDTERERERDRDRQREREREKERLRDTHRERERDRDRQREREREKERETEREREHWRDIQLIQLYYKLFMTTLSAFPHFSRGGAPLRFSSKKLQG